MFLNLRKLKMTSRKLLFLLPPPIFMSGGHRTIFRHINNLANSGHQIHISFLNENGKEYKNNAVRTEILDWFGILKGKIIDFEASKYLEFDCVVATSWWTAYYSTNYDYPKVYFVQDFENLFNPANSIYAKALGTYSLGIDTITIGKWLAKELGQLGSRVKNTPFGIDQKYYYLDPEQSRMDDLVLILDQPDKPRRCHELIQETIDHLRTKNRKIKIYSYGSHKSFLTGVDTHLGNLSEAELGHWYRTAKVGIALSASNPSRIPFEMSACGLPFVDLNLPNNTMDYLNLRHMLAPPLGNYLAKSTLTFLEEIESKLIHGSAISIHDELLVFEKHLIWFLDNPKQEGIERMEMSEISISLQSEIGRHLKTMIPLSLKLKMKKFL